MTDVLREFLDAPEVEYVLTEDMSDGTHPSYGRGLFTTFNCVKSGRVMDANTAQALRALLDEVEGMRMDAAAKQAQIDRLMLEYCPDEMTPEQVVNWGEHQRSVRQT